MRFRGTIAARDGQPTLDEVMPFILAIVGAPVPTDVTTAEAGSAHCGALDAALVKFTDVGALARGAEPLHRRNTATVWRI